MAIHHDHMSGKIGPVIMYKRKGKQCSRSRQRNVNQSAPTKKCSSNLATGSQLSKIIRLSMGDICRFKDGSRHARISGAFLTWLKSGDIHDRPSGPVQLLREFNINPLKMSTCKWDDHISINRNNNIIEIKINELIPSALMALPKRTSVTRLTIRSLAVSIPAMKLTTGVNVFNIGYAETFAATTCSHNIEVLPGSFILTGIAIECLDHHQLPVRWRKGFNAPAWFGLAEWKGF